MISWMRGHPSPVRTGLACVILVRSGLVRGGLIGAILVGGLLGCGSEREAGGPTASTGGVQSGAPEEAALTPAGRDCFDAWNAASNAANRERVAGAFPVAAVSLWDVDEDGSAEVEAEGGREFDGCSYVFHDDETSLEFSGRWSAEGLLWDQPRTGSWTLEQDGLVEDTAAVADDGTLIFSPES